MSADDVDASGCCYRDQRNMIAIFKGKKTIIITISNSDYNYNCFYFPSNIIVIRIVLQVKNPNYYKLLHLLNFKQIYNTLQNCIVLYNAGRETNKTLNNVIFC